MYGRDDKNSTFGMLWGFFISLFDQMEQTKSLVQNHEEELNRWV